MSRIKAIADISEEIMEKLNQAIMETANARIFYEKYKSCLDEARYLRDQKYLPLWNKIYHEEETTIEEKSELGEIEDRLQKAWNDAGNAINSLFE